MWLDGLDPSRIRSIAGTVGGLDHTRGWISSGSHHSCAKGNPRSRGTGKVQISTRQAVGRPFLPESFCSWTQATIHGNSKASLSEPNLNLRSIDVIQKNKQTRQLRDRGFCRHSSVCKRRVVLRSIIYIYHDHIQCKVLAGKSW